MRRGLELTAGGCTILDPVQRGWTEFVFEALILVN